MSETREEMRARLEATRPRWELQNLIREHYFRSSRPWPDGTKPTAPNWNPGCTCGEGMYFFEWDKHLADVLLKAGYIKAPNAGDAPTVGGTVGASGGAVREGPPPS